MKKRLFQVIYGVGAKEVLVDFNETFEYHGHRVPIHSNVREDDLTFTTIESYGPGAVECVYYKHRKVAELAAIAEKYKRLKEQLTKALAE